MSRRFCVCVPARDEVDRIARLIDALAAQDVGGPVPVALCVNNSTDGTAERARRVAERTAGRVLLTVAEVAFADGLAHAGSARRAAMDLGAEMMAADDAVLISTDADCRPPPDWIAQNLLAAAPDRIVGGRIELDDEDRLPASLIALRRRFDRYWAAVRDIEDRIDPCPWDAAPRHGDHTGASLALGVSLYRRCGGVPLLPTGEDRALVEAAVVVGGRLIHPTAVWTRASARAEGRADGGMAADMVRWSRDADAGRSPMVPDLEHWRRRAQWRSVMRTQRSAGDVRQAERSLPPMPCDMALPELHAS